ncbi:MAG: MBL fold metallo-hydrolase [Gemmatimonadetes bacterium]|nr:MBL fold metallo-hydrolase [Gemmatimonadota bacterium]
MPGTAPKLSIMNVGHHSTNTWVVSVGRSRLLADLGWWGHIGLLEADLKRKDIPLKEITHGFATHYHGDHAGAAQDLKNRGMKLIVTPEQLPHIEGLKRVAKPADHYTEISLHDNLVVPIAESRALLKSLGFDGAFVHTPGHSDDSISLVLDSGEAFTGDLTMPMMVGNEDAAVVERSWDLLREAGATQVYPGHGPVRPL